MESSEDVEWELSIFMKTPWYDIQTFVWIIKKMGKVLGKM